MSFIRNIYLKGIKSTEAVLVVICFSFVCIYIISQEIHIPMNFELFTLQYRTTDYIYYC